MNYIFTTEYKSPVGDLLLGVFNEKLVLCDWKYRKKRVEIDKRIQKFFNAEYLAQDTAIAESTIQELDEYFQQKRQIFSIPLELSGTNFQKQVWLELQKIPYGETISYKILSERIGDVKAVRAVASANGANAISIMIPCHRVIGSNGELTGYAGGLRTKKKLLNLEGCILPSEQLSLDIF